MSRIPKLKIEKTKVKVVFRLQFHATHIPQPGWDKLFVTFTPIDSGKVTAKTTKASVRNGNCKWSDPIYETTRLLQDPKTKDYDEKLYKLVVAMGSSRSSLLGEVIINLTDFVDALKPSSAALSLHGCDFGTILHVTVQLLTSKTGFREFEKQRELSVKGVQASSGKRIYDTNEIIIAPAGTSERIDKMPRAREGIAVWGTAQTMTFCDLCIREVERGNRPGTHFNKDGWTNILKDFKNETGVSLGRDKLKNKWDQLKKDWKIWRELKRASTGLGWDPVRNTVVADDAWWEEKIARCPGAKKFRIAGMDPLLEEKLVSMFSGLVALGEHIWTPSTVPPSLSREAEGNAFSPDDVEEYLNEDVPADETPRPTPTTTGPSVRKRKKLPNEIIAEAVTNMATSYSVCTAAKAKIKSRDESLQEAIQALETIPEIVNDPLLYMKAAHVLEDDTRRTMFLSMPPHRHLHFFTFHFNNQKSL